MSNRDAAEEWYHSISKALFERIINPKTPEQKAKENREWNKQWHEIELASGRRKKFGDTWMRWGEPYGGWHEVTDKDLLIDIEGN